MNENNMTGKLLSVKRTDQDTNGKSVVVVTMRCDDDEFERLSINLTESADDVTLSVPYEDYDEYGDDYDGGYGSINDRKAEELAKAESKCQECGDLKLASTLRTICTECASWA